LIVLFSVCYVSVRLFTVLCYQKAPEIDAVVHQSKTPKIELLF